MNDLGWENAGGSMAAEIKIYREACRGAGHKPKETNEGMSGTVHTVSCDLCGYAYHYDSGD